MDDLTPHVGRGQADIRRPPTRFQQFWADFTCQVKRLWSEVVVPIAARALEEASHWSTIAQRSLTVSAGLARLGWPPIHYSHQALHEELERIFQAAEPAMQDQVESAIRRHLLKDHAGGLAKDWRENPILESRQPIIDDALACHENELWFGAVPLWYSLTEGLLMEQLAPNNPIQPRKGQRRVGVRDCLTLISTPHVELPAWNGIAAFSKKQAWSQYLGSPDSPTNNRHGIMHGKSTDYGTSENALKAMLLFDFVQASLRTGVLEHQGTIHAPGCLEIIDHPSNMVYFQNAWWGIAFGQFTGKPSCQRCSEDLDERFMHPRLLHLIDQRYPQLQLAAGVQQNGENSGT